MCQREEFIVVVLAKMILVFDFDLMLCCSSMYSCGFLQNHRHVAAQILMASGVKVESRDHQGSLRGFQVVPTKRGKLYFYYNYF